MKPRYVILVLLASNTLLFASLGTPFDKSKSPPMSLPDAYQKAMTVLGSNTNEYHCISVTAVIMPPGVSSPAWRFTFYSTKTPPKERLVFIGMTTNDFVRGLIARQLQAAPNTSLLSATKPKGSIDFHGVSTEQALDFYADISRFKLVVGSRVHQLHEPIYLHAAEASKNEMKKLLKKALQQQAGIVLTSLGDDRVSVTYNDALPITQHHK